MLWRPFLLSLLHPLTVRVHELGFHVFSPPVTCRSLLPPAPASYSSLRDFLSYPCFYLQHSWRVKVHSAAPLLAAVSTWEHLLPLLVSFSLPSLTFDVLSCLWVHSAKLLGPALFPAKPSPLILWMNICRWINSKKQSNCYKTQ